MKSLTTRDLKVNFLGIIPTLKDKTDVLNPQEIVSLSALLTFSGKSIKSTLKEIKNKGEDFNEKMELIMRKSSLKGHASLATTPVLCFSFEGSKFFDSGLTGMVFASALMASGRRTNTTAKDIIYPTGILKNKQAKKIYQDVSKKNIDFFNYLLSNEVQKDESSKILQYGIYGAGIIQFPIESIISLKREYEIEKEWMPEEIGFLLKEIESQLNKFGIDLLYNTRFVAPRNIYPYPHIFTNPKKTNLVRDLMKKKKSKDGFEIISSDFVVTPEFKKRLKELRNEIKKTFKSKKNIKEKWMKLLLMRRQITRDYALSANIKILSSVAWRVWGDKKRHRTVPMIVESVYYCVDRAFEIFKKYNKQIENRKLNEEILDKINSIFSIPPTVRNHKKFLYKYLNRASDSLFAYKELIKLGIKERDALFIIPRGLKLDVLQDYNFYNLIAGYYPLRICSTAEEELHHLTTKEITAMRKLLRKKKLGWLAEHIVPKCATVGFCLEQKTCGKIKQAVKNYSDEFHQEMMKSLERRFKKNKR